MIVLKMPTSGTLIEPVDILILQRLSREYEMVVKVQKSLLDTVIHSPSRSWHWPVYILGLLAGLWSGHYYPQLCLECSLGTALLASTGGARPAVGEGSKSQSAVSLRLGEIPCLLVTTGSKSHVYWIFLNLAHGTY